MEYTINTNSTYNSLEIIFSGKPSEAVRDILKECRFRWHNVKKLWYGYGDKTELESKINEAEKPYIIPEYTKVEEGTLYEGWKGGNNAKWRDDNELKKLLQADFKKCGLKASIRKERAGYLTAMCFTISVDASELITEAEYYKAHKDDYISPNEWHNYRDENGKITSIHGQKYYELDENAPETLALKENIIKTLYYLTVKEAESTSGRINLEIFKPEAQRQIKLVKEIVGSYNHDQSNSMIDYFDRDIYDDYAIKIIGEA